MLESPSWRALKWINHLSGAKATTPGLPRVVGVPAVPTSCLKLPLPRYRTRSCLWDFYQSLAKNLQDKEYWEDQSTVLCAICWLLTKIDWLWKNSYLINCIFNRFALFDYNYFNLCVLLILLAQVGIHGLASERGWQWSLLCTLRGSRNTFFITT